MKKSLIALAVLAAAGAASAQSSVTLFGIVDATLMMGRGTVTDKNQLGNSGYNSSRLGFRGVEDLGGGMSASFWLEAGVNNDNGTGAATSTNNQATGGAITTTATGASAGLSTNGSQGLTFNRRSTVSLAGGWGELRLGRDYTPQFWNLAVFDPFGYNGVGTTQTAGNVGGATGVRASNTIGYFLPGNLGGFYGQVQMYLGENSKPGGVTEDDGNGFGIRLGFATGPFNVAVATSRTDYAAGDTRMTNIGGQYDLGMAKLMAHVSRDRAGTLDGKGWLFGALVPVGAGEIRASVSRYQTDAVTDPRSTKLALGYVHNLSKRTAVYTTIARVKNNGAAAVALNGATTGAGTSSSGWDLGLRHSF